LWTNFSMKCHKVCLRALNEIYWISVFSHSFKKVEICWWSLCVLKCSIGNVLEVNFSWAPVLYIPHHLGKISKCVNCLNKMPLMIDDFTANRTPSFR
jgi:hypothetical protein